MFFCLKRRISVHRRLRRIAKSYRTPGKSEFPKVRKMVPLLLENLLTSCCTACVPLYPTGICSCLPDHIRSTAKGWIPRGMGAPRYVIKYYLPIHVLSQLLSGTMYENKRFRTELLNTIREIGSSFPPVIILPVRNLTISFRRISTSCDTQSPTTSFT